MGEHRSHFGSRYPLGPMRQRRPFCPGLNLFSIIAANALMSAEAIECKKNLKIQKFCKCFNHAQKVPKDGHPLLPKARLPKLFLFELFFFFKRLGVRRVWGAWGRGRGPAPWPGRCMPCNAVRHLAWPIILPRAIWLASSTDKPNFPKHPQKWPIR